jgi:hypothetical protein
MPRESEYVYIVRAGILTCKGGRATFKMLRRKSKTQLVNEERNTQNAIALLNYLKHIAQQQLMLRTQVFTKNFLITKNASATF